jgi:hypothetical protein
VSYSATGPAQQIADKTGARGTLLASKTWGDTFGVLAGISVNRQQAAHHRLRDRRPDQRQPVGGPEYLADPQQYRRRQLDIPATVPAGAGAGLVPGTVIDQAFLLANNPGLNIGQIDNALVPRLGRTLDNFGTRDKGAAIISLEWRPLDNLHFYVDSLYSKRDDDMSRISYTWAMRNEAAIPLNMSVDKQRLQQRVYRDRRHLRQRASTSSNTARAATRST